jgi:peptidoglycan/xylan/chitin deacetylase (PgdA/CDA1 family)
MLFLRASQALALGLGLLGASAQSTSTHTVHAAQTIKAVPMSKKLIAFTFDDGPNRRYTPKVLQLLAQYHAHATFFVIGQEVQRYPEVIQSLDHAGMEIGNHGMHHRWLRNMSAEAVRDDVTAGADAIVAAGGPKPYLYRLPAALSDDTSRQVLGNLGYTLVSWSVDTRDWRRTISPERIAKTILRDAGPGRIVIMHDGPAHRAATMMALAQALPALEGQGYQIVSVGELLRNSDFAAQRMIPPGGPHPVAKPRRQVKSSRTTPRRGWLQTVLPRRAS